MMKKILFEDALILNFTRAMRFLVHVLPLPVSFAIARQIGNFVYFTSKRRHIAYRNLRAAFSRQMSRKQMRRIARRSMQNLAMSAVELLRFPDMNKRYIEEHLKLTGTDRFKEPLDRGQGVIFMTGHFGNWEMLNIAAGVLGYPMLVLARTQKHPRSDDYLNALRASKGSVVIRKGMPVREILKALKAGRIVGILSDQDAGKTGTMVEFFGRLSSSPAGAAAFAMRTDTRVFPVFIFRERDNRHRVEMEPALKMPEAGLSPEEGQRQMLQEFARVFESKIRSCPDQWLWGHRRWKSTPDRSVLILSDGKAGHLNQSMAVLDALRKQRVEKGLDASRLQFKVIQIRFRSPWRRRFLDTLSVITAGRLPFKPFLLKFALTPTCYNEVFAAYADLVISCGSSLAAVNTLVRHENLARSIVLMKPSISRKCFDVVLALEHDRMTPKGNVFVTERALSPLSREVLVSEAKKLADQLKLNGTGRRIGFLAGGDASGFKYEPRSFESVLSWLQRFAKTQNAQVLATSSRRTPGWADTLMKERLSDRNLCPFLVIANEDNRPNAVAGILGLSDIVIVSGESVSMVSEAVASGKPVYVFLPAESSRLKPKMELFLKQLETKGRIRRVGSGRFDGVIAADTNYFHVCDPDPDQAVLKRAVEKAAL